MSDYEKGGWRNDPTANPRGSGNRDEEHSSSSGDVFFGWIGVIGGVLCALYILGVIL